MASRTFPQPVGTNASPDYSVYADEAPVYVQDVGIAAYAAFEADGPVRVTVEGPRKLEQATIHPLKQGIPAVSTEGRITVDLPGPGAWWFEIPGGKPLYVWVTAPDANRPDPDDPNVRFFAAGRVYDEGTITLTSGQTLYIEGGAIVRGHVIAHEAENIRIAGQGVLDGSWLREREMHRHFVMLDSCRNVTIEDVILIQPPTWMIVLGACEDVLIRGVHEIGPGNGNDGCDIVGCQRVTLRDCFFFNGDDCVVIKAMDPRHSNPAVTRSWARDVTEILVEGCVFLNDRGGNGCEIGHELRTDRVGEITFRNVDICHVHGYGAPLSIHAGDRATVENILFEDIRIEHHYDQWVDIRVMKSQFNHDEERGRIRNVVFRNVDTRESEANAGYTMSCIGGWDADHLVENVTFENCTYNGRKLTSIDDLDIFTRHVKDIRFR